MWIGKTLRALAVVLIIGSLGALVWAVAQRCNFPFALEWMEGGMLQHAARLRQGLPLYVEPNPDFTPFPYPPLFPWMMSLLPGDSWSFLGPRLLALCGYVGVAVCLMWIARRQGVGRLGQALGLAVWAGGYAFAGGWFDVARADGWALFLHLAGVCCLWGEGGRKRAVAAGLLFMLSGLAKQIGWPLGLLCTVAYTLQRKPGVPELWGTLLFGTLGLFLWLPHWFGDWAYYYIFEVLAGHPTQADWSVLLTKLARLVPGFILAGWFLARASKKSDPSAGQAPMVAALLLGWLAVFAMGVVHAGAYDNVYLPALLAAALGVALSGTIGVHGPIPKPILTRLALGLCVVQLGALAYDPRTWVPSDEYTASCRDLERWVAQSQEAVLAPGHGYLLERRELASGFHWMALFDLAASGDGTQGQRLWSQVKQRVAQGDYPRAMADRLGGGAGMDLESEMGVLYARFHPRVGGPRGKSQGRMGPGRGGRPLQAPPSGAPWYPGEWYSNPVIPSQ